MIYEALQQAGASEPARNAYRQCGDSAYVLRSVEHPEVLRIAGNFCHNRWCLPCANSRARVLSLNIAEHVRKAGCRFITLTIRADKESLDVLFCRLYAGFSKLKRTDLWRKTQTGGVAILEVKRNAKTNIWHPHLHILSQGKYLDHALLRHVWHNITKDSHVVDVRAVKHPEEATRYVAKYASKPFDSTLFASMETLVEAIKALAGKRMIIAFGTWRRLKLTAAPSEGAWETLGSLQSLLQRAAVGETEPVRIVGIVLGTDALYWIARAPPAALIDDVPSWSHLPEHVQQLLTFA